METESMVRFHEAPKDGYVSEEYSINLAVISHVATRSKVS